MTIATEPSLNEIGMVIDLAHALIETEDSNTAIEEPISDTEKAAVENAREWLVALSNLPPADEIALACAVLEKNGLKVRTGVEGLVALDTDTTPFDIILTVSTVHITPELAEALNGGETFGTILFDKGEHGWFIYSKSSTCADPLLSDLLSFAADHGAGWLCIDVDGTIVETLTDYSDLWE